MFSIRGRWIEEHNGMRGYWRDYHPDSIDGKYRSAVRVFEPLASDDCPHDSYEIESASVSRRYQSKDGTYSPQHITVDVCCDACGLYGELLLSTDAQSLRRNYEYIYWNTPRIVSRLVMVDTGYPEWQAQQDLEQAKSEKS